MLQDILKDVSMNGRMAYGIMCFEKFVIEKYSSKDWNILVKQLWCATSEFWDNWSEKTMEYIPEYLFEFEDFESSEFEYITKEEYLKLNDLLKGIDDKVNQLLLKLLEIEEVYSYTCIPGYGEESLKILKDIARMLEKENIPLPDPKLVEFSKFSEKNGWGEPFDGTKLSIILNK